MSLLYLVGQRFNLLERASTVATSPSADASYPATSIYDGRPEKPWKPSAVATSYKVVMDPLVVQAFEGSFPPTGWTVSGSVTQSSAAPVYLGTYYVALNGSTAQASITYSLTNVKAGEVVTISAGYEDSAKLRVYNPHTGKFWTGNAWSTATAYAYEHTGAWAQVAEAITVEAMDVTGRESMTLTVDFLSTSGTTGAFDHVFMYSDVDFASIHGHPFDRCATMYLDSSTDGTTYTNRKSGATSSVSSYLYMSSGSVSAPYWRIRVDVLDSTIPAAPYIGEAVIGNAIVASRAQSPEWRVGRSFVSVRSASRSGTAWVYALTPHETRSLDMSFFVGSSAEHNELLDSWLRSSVGGRHPIVIVPDSDETEVIHGRIDPDTVTTREWMQQRRLSVSIVESPHPFVGS